MAAATVLALLAGLVLPVAGSAGASGSAVAFATGADDDAGPGPITKVVELLQGMQKDLKKEYKDDQENYKEIQCWCETNDKEKKQAVLDAQQRIKELDAKILDTTAEKGKLTAEIPGLKKDIEQQVASLAEAVAQRKKEAAAFHEQEKELLTSIELLKGAITALSKHHTDALLQSDDKEDAEVVALKPTLRRLIHRHMPLFGWLQESRDKDMLLSFLDANEELLTLDPGMTPSQPNFASAGAPVLLQRRSGIPVFQSYGAKSGAIFGMLRQMRESMQEDLPVIQKEEMGKIDAFAELKGEKEAIIAHLKEQLPVKQRALAEAKEEIIFSKSDLKDTKNSLAMDRNFLSEMLKKCLNADAEWEEREKAWLEEMKAVAEVIAVLSSQEVKDGQQATFLKKRKAAAAASFLQLHMEAEPAKPGKASQLRALALQALDRAANQVGTSGQESAALLATSDRPFWPAQAALLATALRDLQSIDQMDDPFAKIIKVVDELVVKLKQEQADEVKFRDYCKEEFHENEVQTTRKQAKLDRLGPKMEKLDADIQALEREVKQLQMEIYDAKVELQRASEDRKKENYEFQTIIHDQTVTQSALDWAYNRMAATYNKRKSLLQQPAGSDVPAEVWHNTPEFQDRQKSGRSNTVLVLLKKLAGEAKVVKDTSLNGENIAEETYEALVTDTNNAVRAKSKTIRDKMEEKSALDEEKELTKAAMAELLKELEGLSTAKGALKLECDFVVKNFDLRQQARAEEIDGLAEVKAILRGMRDD